MPLDNTEYRRREVFTQLIGFRRARKSQQQQISQVQHSRYFIDGYKGSIEGSYTITCPPTHQEFTNSTVFIPVYPIQLAKSAKSKLTRIGIYMARLWDMAVVFAPPLRHYHLVLCRVCSSDDFAVEKPEWRRRSRGDTYWVSRPNVSKNVSSMWPGISEIAPCCKFYK